MPLDLPQTASIRCFVVLYNEASPCYLFSIRHGVSWFSICFTALTTAASKSSFGSDTALIFATLHDKHRGYLSFIVYNSNVHCYSIGFGEASPKPRTSTIHFEVTLVANHLGIVTTFSFNNSDFQDHHSRSMSLSNGSSHSNPLLHCSKKMM